MDAGDGLAAGVQVGPDGVVEGAATSSSFTTARPFGADAPSGDVGERASSSDGGPAMGATTVPARISGATAGAEGDAEKGIATVGAGI